MVAIALCPDNCYICGDRDKIWENQWGKAMKGEVFRLLAIAALCSALIVAGRALIGDTALAEHGLQLRIEKR